MMFWCVVMLICVMCDDCVRDLFVNLYWGGGGK